MAIGKKRPWDVIVIGGGPAGLASAITARQNGLSTLLFDHRAPPVVTIGKALHPGSECILARLGVADAFRKGGFSRSSGYHVRRWGTDVFIPYRLSPGRSWQGFELYGSQIREILTRRYRELGGVAVEGEYVSGIVSKNARPIGVRFNDQVVEATLIVDASGSQGFLRRCHGLVPLYGSPRLFATYSADKSIAEHDYPSFVCLKDSWRWSARMSDGLTSCVHLNLNGSKHRSPQEKAAEVTWRMIPDCAGPGYAIVGDAAARLDPARGGGVLRALISGIWAIALFNRDPDSNAACSAALSYRNWMTRWVRTDAATLAEMYVATPFNVSWPRFHRWSRTTLPKTA